MKAVGIFFACWYLWLPLTFWLGRVFCRRFCPLGLSQSLINLVFHPKTRVRRVCTRLPRSGFQRFVNWALVAAYFLAPLGYWLHPWGIFGRVLVWFVPGVVLFALVLLTAAIGEGRFWCNWICPLGTMFDLAARLGWRPDRIARGCDRCRKCWAKAEEPLPATGGASRREVIRGVAAAAVAEKVTDGGFADVSLPGLPARERAVLPPGAGNADDFSRRCIACGLCMLACPEKVLKPSVRLRTFGQPEMDFRHGHCLLGCTRCVDVCPAGALGPLSAAARPTVHMGYAVWQPDICVRKTTRDACTACVRKCPVRAIHLVKGFPVVDRVKCVGCGACEHVCPARPMPAIQVKGVEMQQKTEPMSSAEILAEMREQITRGGASVMVARDGVIVAREEGRGIAPLMKLLDAGALKDALVVDRVIGRAAAAICIQGGAARIVTLLMSDDAAQLLSPRGLPFEADRRVPRILNRDKSDRCPMEKAISGLTEPAEMVTTLRKAMKR